MQTALPGYAAAAAGQGMLVLQQGAAGAAAEVGMVRAAAVGGTTGQHSLSMGAALGAVAVHQQHVAAQPQQQQQQQAGLMQLSHMQ